MFVAQLFRSGPGWDATKSAEEHVDWPEHALFMDDLVDSGFVVLGGPLDDGLRVMLVIEATSEEAVRATLARDPWFDTILLISTVNEWDVRLDGRAR